MGSKTILYCKEVVSLLSSPQLKGTVSVFQRRKPAFLAPLVFALFREYQRGGHSRILVRGLSNISVHFPGICWQIPYCSPQFVKNVRNWKSDCGRSSLALLLNLQKNGRERHDTSKLQLQIRGTSGYSYTTRGGNIQRNHPQVNRTLSNLGENQIGCKARLMTD